MVEITSPSIYKYRVLTRFIVDDKPANINRFINKLKLNESTDDEDFGDDDCAEPVEKSIQPSNQEVQEVLQQLREIPCTPQFRLNAEIQKTVRRCWQNVPGAIAYLKEAIRTWKGIKSPEAVFVAACKEGRKPEAQQVKSAVKDWFEWARRERIVIAMSRETVYTPDGAAVAVAEMMRRFPVGE